uniref:Uncharacterized protein n=1 Tax=Arundo donax TaxID=35708 RepID=A0A0A8ZN15_ARUDO
MTLHLRKVNESNDTKFTHVSVQLPVQPHPRNMVRKSKQELNRVSHLS